MKTLEQLLRHLLRAEVDEVALISDRLPCAHIDGSFEPLDDTAPEVDRILEMLVAAGGSRYVDSLGPTPKTWTARLGGLVVNVSAVMPDEDEVQARFSLAKREAKVEPKKRSNRPEARKSVRPESRKSGRPGKVSVKPPATREGKSQAAPGRGPHQRTSRERISVGRMRAPSFGDIVLDRESLPPPKAASSVPPSQTSAMRQAATMPTLKAVRIDVPQGRKEEPMGTSADAFSVIEADTKKKALSRRDTLQSQSQDTTLLRPYLAKARDARATDLHVVAGRPLLLRVAGELKPSGAALSAEEVERILLPCVPARLTATLADVGSCDFALQDAELGRFRVNIGRQQTGYKGTVRLIAKDVPTLEQLGLPAAIGAATRHHQGLIVVTGPTGHGKTSTMSAIVDILNRESSAHIITVEDPIEFIHARKKAIVSQREVGTHTRSFANALKASLREDPDVIVVGELRDTETVRMAVAASETGHLVIGTMNTPSAAKTIDRLIDLFPPADQPQVRTTLSSGLRLIVSQRLVPSVDKSRMHVAVELLPGSIPLSALIRENKTFQIPSLQQRSRALGIVRLDDSLADLVHGCHVALEVAKQFAEAPMELEALVGMRRGKPDPGMTRRGA